MKNEAIEQFKARVISLAQQDKDILGVAAAGSAISGETDEYSDLDLVIVSRLPIAPDRARMRAFAARFPGLIAEFTGEHVGERSLLICLYENPLLHVDFKFVQAHELAERIETPVILHEKEGILTEAYGRGEARWPQSDLQWIEDRFWIWTHYAVLKLGRGEFLEALDFLAFLRSTALSPLLHRKYGRAERGVRRMEQWLNIDDLTLVKRTVATHSRDGIVSAIGASIELYLQLREGAFAAHVNRNERAQAAALAYFRQVSA